MLKFTPIITILCVVLILGSSQRTAPCPLVYSLGSVITGRITIAEQKGLIPLVQGQDVQCYNYSLPYSFSSVPSVGIAIHDFESLPTNDLFFSIKTIRTDSVDSVPLLVRTHWKYTPWKKMSFSILATNRDDIQLGYYQVDSGSLGACQPGKNIHVLLPFRTSVALADVHHHVFLHGFEISTQLFSENARSPFELQVLQTATNSSGIVVFFTVTTITQVQAIHLSYVIWGNTNLTIVDGKWSSDEFTGGEINHIPYSNIGRNYARIFGLTGFIINHQNQDVSFETMWTGSKFIFDLAHSTALTKYLSFQYIFFLGSECSDCPNYPFIFNGTCRQYCPEGYHATGENICIDCGEGHYWNGTGCIKQCPASQYLNFATNQCECPAGLFWNGAICLSCQGGKIFNSGKNTCECPEGTRWNGFGCATTEICDQGREWNVFKYMCECALNTVWNGTYCAKIISCQNGQIPDGANGCICPTATHWNGNWCEPDNCIGGQVWADSGCECEPGYNFNGSLCLLCINGQQWNPIRRTCDCPANYTWDGNMCSKRVYCSGGRVYNTQYDLCLCDGEKFWNGWNCMVKPDCCCGQVWNETSFQCNCPQSFNWDGNSCVLCLNGKVWDEDTRTCQCQAGTQWNGQFCVVIQACQGGMIWNQNTFSCECPSITVWNGNYCIQNPCSGGKVWNTIRRECQCLGTQVFVNGRCVLPTSVCLAPKIWDSNQYKCVCPPGTWERGSTCDPVPVCSGNQIYYPTTNKCDCEPGKVFIESKGTCGDPTCPVGERWDGYGCVDISCPPNSYYNGTECVCPDPRDLCLPWQYYNGVDCVYVPGSCPDGTQWNGTYCEAVGNCPVGYYWTGTRCAALPQKCVPPTTWLNNRCQVSSTCPYGTYFKNGNCFPYVPCQAGQVWNDSTINCVCPEGTEWNGDKCVACSGGRTWEPFEGCVCGTGYFFAGVRCERVTSTRCGAIPHAFWDGVQCVCHEGFQSLGMQCVCEGVVTGQRCDRCAHRPNSEWRFGSCQCMDGYTLYGTQCLANQIGSDLPEECNVGTFYDSQQKRCLPCPTGCLSCSSSYVCDVCRPEFNYDATSELCVEHCGDGKKFVLHCDDGNNINGDGCSESCEVELGYSCRGGSPNSADTCIVYEPTQVTFIHTGQIRYSSKIIVNVKIDYLPSELIQSSDCLDACSNVINGEIVKGDEAISIRSSYIAGTSYSFSIDIEFGRSYIGIFTLQVSVNPDIAVKYFGAVSTAQTLQIQVNPAYLSLAVDRDDRL